MTKKSALREENFRLWTRVTGLRSDNKTLAKSLSSVQEARNAIAYELYLTHKDLETAPKVSLNHLRNLSHKLLIAQEERDLAKSAYKVLQTTLREAGDELDLVTASRDTAVSDLQQSRDFYGKVLPKYQRIREKYMILVRSNSLVKDELKKVEILRDSAVVEADQGRVRLECSRKTYQVACTLNRALKKEASVLATKLEEAETLLDEQEQELESLANAYLRLVADLL